MNLIFTGRSTRRQFVSQILASAFLISQRPLFASPGAAQFPFVAVPPEASGIKWTHTSGKSPEKYLPESSGPGCAFLDYDNDGWMDIYLVNSGKCDFYNPQNAAPQRALSQQSRWNLH